MANASFSLTREIEVRVSENLQQGVTHCPIDSTMFFKKSPSLGMAARQHFKLGMMHEVVGGVSVKPYAVLEVHPAERTARIVNDAEMERAAQLNDSAHFSTNSTAFCMVMERAGGTEAGLIRKAVIERMLRNARNPSESTKLSRLLRDINISQAARDRNTGNQAPSAESEVTRRLGNIFDNYTHKAIHSKIFSAVSSIVGKLHEGGIAHGDLFGWNVMVTNGSTFSIVLIDPNAECGCRATRCAHFEKQAIWDDVHVKAFGTPFTRIFWSVV